MEFGFNDVTKRRSSVCKQERDGPLSRAARYCIPDCWVGGHSFYASVASLSRAEKSFVMLTLGRFCQEYPETVARQRKVRLFWTLTGPMPTSVFFSPATFVSAVIRATNCRRQRKRPPTSWLYQVTDSDSRQADAGLC